MSSPLDSPSGRAPRSCRRRSDGSGRLREMQRMPNKSAGKRRFARIDRLPPYVFNVTAELKLAARRRGEDIVDMSMGNPDGATPAHIVAKLMDVAQRPDTHGYSTSKGIPRLRRAISHSYQDRYRGAIDRSEARRV